MKKKTWLALLLCALLLLSLTGCGGSGADTPELETENGLRPVTVVLDYVPNTNHTGLYTALEKGYYVEAGLDVRIIEPGDSATPALIAAGQGDFGISYQEDVTYALTAEDPLPIKAIAAIIQHNTSGFATYKEKNIISPADFEGKVYAGWGSPAEEAVIKAVMNSMGADPEQISMVLSDGTGYGVLRDKVDVMWFFWAWDGISSELAGVPINYMELREFDERLDYYTPVLIANTDTIENDPELVQAFMTATTKGYEYVIANPEEGAEIIHQYAPDYDLEMLTLSQQYLAEKYSEDSAKWGLMKAEVWDNYTEFMMENGLIETTIAAQECFTNEFIN